MWRAVARFLACFSLIALGWLCVIWIRSVNHGNAWSCRTSLSGDERVIQHDVHVQVSRGTFQARAAEKGFSLDHHEFLLFWFPDATEMFWVQGWRRAEVLSAEPGPAFGFNQFHKRNGSPTYELVLPLWAVVLILLPAPAWQAALMLNRRQRWRKGFCAHCGYDLRASPDRCPECGRPPGAPPLSNYIRRIPALAIGPVVAFFFLLAMPTLGLGLLTYLHQEDVKAFQRRYALHLACRRNDHEMVRRLLDSGADIERPLRWSGKRCLHIAAGEGSSDAVKVLLAAGATASPQDDDMDTPLHLAVRKEDFDSIRLLLEHGADPSISNGRETSATLAAQREIELSAAALELRRK